MPPNFLKGVGRADAGEEEVTVSYHCLSGTAGHPLCGLVMKRRKARYLYEVSVGMS